MSATAGALIGYATLSLLLLAGLAVYRTSQVLAGRRAANSFSPDGSDVSPFGSRLTRAHANCYEGLPAFAALALVALVTGNQAVTDPLAPWALAARIAQSAAHLSSTSNLGVQVRFTFFVVVFAIQLWWAFGLLRVWLGG